MRNHNVLSNIFYSVKYIYRISKASIFLAVLSSLLSSFLVLLNIVTTRLILNSLTLQNEPTLVVLALAISFFVTITVSSINAVLVNIITAKINEKIGRSVNLSIYSHAMKYPLSSFDDPKFYDNYYFVIQNAESSFNSMVSILMSIITAALSSTGIIGYITAISPILIPIVAFSVSICCILAFKIRATQHNYQLETTADRRKQNYINRIFYQIEYAKEVRSYSDSALFFSKYDLAYENIQILNQKFGCKLAKYSFFQGAVQISANISILGVLAFRVFQGLISVGDFVVSQNGAQQLASQITAFINAIPAIYAQNLNIEKIRDFYEAAENYAEPAYPSPICSIEKIDAHNLSFFYGQDFGLKNISFTSKRGQRIAIVGSNGAGKSTLVKLIGGFVYPLSGSIIINDQWALDALPISYVHAKIGYVFQDFHLFSFSIAENILMHAVGDELDKKKVIDALQFVGLLDKVQSLPNSYNTYISKEFSDSGSCFSGGELQKIALARAYAQNYDVLILDELTSALDPYAEDAIQRMIAKIAADKIVFLISHRLLMMPEMDTIIYMEEGEIIEQGTHVELMERQGNYAKMYTLQAEKYVKGENLPL